MSADPDGVMEGRHESDFDDRAYSALLVLAATLGVSVGMALQLLAPGEGIQRIGEMCAYLALWAGLLGFLGALDLDGVRTWLGALGATIGVPGVLVALASTSLYLGGYGPVTRFPAFLELAGVDETTRVGAQVAGSAAYVVGSVMVVVADDARDDRTTAG